eukprot:GHVT01009896.1.p1 GENE.GHVT01009896.1~~GHVT01009896.1.p1  ORF type:complete len:193 (+),score=44.52 GHVT01009896.1:290-868(+)
MDKPKRVVPSLCRGFELDRSECTYIERDVILYALAMGVGRDEVTTDETLKFVYENAEQFSALPTFAVVIPAMEKLFGALIECPGLPEFNPMFLLHGEQTVRLLRPLPTSCCVLNVVRIVDVLDKKKGALVRILAESFSREDAGLLCTNEYSLFIKGIGRRRLNGPSASEQNAPKTIDALSAPSKARGLGLFR